MFYSKIVPLGIHLPGNIPFNPRLHPFFFSNQTWKMLSNSTQVDRSWEYWTVLTTDLEQPWWAVSHTSTQRGDGEIQQRIRAAPAMWEGAPRGMATL